MAIDKCLSTTPNVKVWALKNIYEICQSKIMYGVVLDEAWKEIDKPYRRFCKKILGLPRCAVNSVAEMELGRDSRRGKVIWLTVKYWQIMMHMDIQFPFRQCYEWHKGTMI
jgi:hypothetical protein